MICWPCYADQQVINKVWEVGVNMKDVCDRRVVEKMVREVMGVKREETMKSAREMERLARESVSKGGGSYANLGSLIGDV